MPDNENSLHENYLSSKLGLEHNVANIEAEYRRIVPFIRYNYGKRMKSKASTARILDVGSGLGHFLYGLKELGYENVRGLDNSKDCAEFCRKKGFVVIEDDALQYFKATPEKFDVIIMNDIIEHLKKDTIIDTLRMIRQCLNQDGVLFIKTFNAANPLLGFDARYVDFTHEVGFTEASLRQVLLIAGFESEKIAVYPSHLYVFFANPLNYVAWFLNSSVNLFLKSYAILNGKLSSRIFTKNILAVASVGHKSV